MHSFRAAARASQTYLKFSPLLNQSKVDSQKPKSALPEKCVRRAAQTLGVRIYAFPETALGKSGSAIVAAVGARPDAIGDRRFFFIERPALPAKAGQA